MVQFKIKLNITEPKHYLNFLVAYSFNVTRDMKIGKGYLIGTNILLQKRKILSIELESTKGVKYKYLIRKYMKEHSKVKVKDMKIKHIKNIDNHHYYIALLTNVNKHLRAIKNTINSLDEFTWRTFYEIYTPLSDKDLVKKNIYNNFTRRDINIFLGNLNIGDIYRLIGDII